MKIYLYKILLVIVAVTAIKSSYAQFKDSKTFSKGVRMTDNGKMSINNRHGNITISSWDKDSLVVKATISGQSKSLSKLQESLANTNLDFKKSGTAVEISTLFANTSFSQGVNDVLSAAGVSNEISVVYDIKIPKGTDMSLSNKYGDIYLTTHTGNVYADISHGNFRALSLNKVGYLRTNFGDVYIESVNNLKGNFLFSSVEIQSGGTLDLESKSSEYEVKSARDFRITTTNDKIDLNKVNSISIAGTLSRISIDKLTKSSSISLKYGKVRIKEIQKGVCSFMVTTTRTTLDLRFEQGANKILSGMLTDCDIEIRKSNNTLEHSESPSLNVVIGNKSLAECTYQFNCQKGKIYIQ